MFGNIYIIDDDSMSLSASKHELADFTQFVTCFDSTPKALKAILNLERSNATPFIVFLDINMPLIDGLYFLEMMDTQDQDIKDRCKIILLSSAICIEEINMLRKHPLVIDFIPKPLDQDAVNMLSDILGLMTPVSY